MVLLKLTGLTLAFFFGKLDKDNASGTGFLSFSHVIKICDSFVDFKLVVSINGSLVNFNASCFFSLISPMIIPPSLAIKVLLLFCLRLERNYKKSNGLGIKLQITLIIWYVYSLIHSKETRNYE